MAEELLNFPFFWGLTFEDGSKVTSVEIPFWDAIPFSKRIRLAWVRYGGLRQIHFDGFAEICVARWVGAVMGGNKIHGIMVTENLRDAGYKETLMLASGDVRIYRPEKIGILPSAFRRGIL